MKVNLIEVLPENCAGCRLCEMVCSLRHEQECSTTKSRIKILQGKEWAFDFPLLCIQCAEAPCIKSCPNEALYRNEATGIVVVDAACSGCGECLTVCPVHALGLEEDKGIIFKCDQCGGDPECVKSCPREVLVLKEVDIDSTTRKSYLEKASNVLKIYETISN